ncbi:SCO family protein [Reichenbachiella agarivorans]|uniref:SCO family protein n=1 Tax=Reichenbachiella agarivorans TaxID=2979464 RepID=A0ABY6CL32_9BACT|nr:SCO family protein [Reichenbachiella agarivorans]UXP31237.1 SCO family protein [Reichenbachiella agarivorans]
MINRMLALCVVMISACTQSKNNTSTTDTLPYYSEASFTPQWFSTDYELPTDFHQIPPFRLINQTGQTITEQSVEGKILIVDFFFASCPGICPKMTTNMSLLQQEYLPDTMIVLLSHSVTPDRDSVSVLRQYADNYKVIDGKWHLLTGDRTQIYELGRNHYFVEENLGRSKSPDDFLHTENFILVDQNRHIRGIYNGLNKSSLNQLIADIKILKQ